MIYQRTPPTSVGIGLQQHLYFDDMDEYQHLPKQPNAAPGSDAYCITTKKAYILSGEDNWEEQ